VSGSSLIGAGVIVSCQARADNPLHGPVHMAAMARAAEAGGAIAIRANGAVDVAAIRAATRLPIVGIAKRWSEGFDVYITPDIADARAVAAAGADIVAIDATTRWRDGTPLAELIGRIKTELGKPVLADISTVEEGIAAARLGCDIVATTLSGATPYSPQIPGPDLELVRALVAAVDVPVVAEGRFWTPEEVAQAFALGARAVVIGTAITNPREITRRFVRAVPRGSAPQ
jgi:putative N-acetylmannosamine-6-phosphate epimerase